MWYTNKTKGKAENTGAGQEVKIGEVCPEAWSEHKAELSCEAVPCLFTGGLWALVA